MGSDAYRAPTRRRRACAATLYATSNVIRDRQMERLTSGRARGACDARAAFGMYSAKCKFRSGATRTASADDGSSSTRCLATIVGEGRLPGKCCCFKCERQAMTRTTVRDRLQTSADLEIAEFKREIAAEKDYMRYRISANYV